jgi:sulfite reductase alpha subunit-like flavoprotein
MEWNTNLGNICKSFPMNEPGNMELALQHFKLDKDDPIIIKKVSGHVRRNFPPIIDAPINAQQVLQGYLELSAPSSKNQIKTVALYTKGRET